MEIKILRNDVAIPKNQTAGSAGIDLTADHDSMIYPGEVVMFGSGIALNMADNSMAALVMARSGIALKRQLVPVNCVGLIDSDYCDEIKVALTNTGNDAQEVKAGERIAQLIFIPVIHPVFKVVDEFTNGTDRGGFGSTGT